MNQHGPQNNITQNQPWFSQMKMGVALVKLSPKLFSQNAFKKLLWNFKKEIY